TVMFAQKVEDANFIRHFGDKWILRLGADWALVDVSGECMLAFDADGRIAGANSGARHMLTATTDDATRIALVGAHLSNVFKANMDDIWRVARSGTTSDRTVLSTRSHELFYAMATPPRHALSKAPRSPVQPGEALQPVPTCPALDRLAGDDKTMQRLIDQAKRLVNKKLNILLHGETGTGKELMARALHDSSHRNRGAFVAVNCASIPESLIESELFGYTPGSFTGGRAKGSRGLILQSGGGTLFLDEVGDMPLHLQTRLLRVLSEHEVMPLGAQTPLPVDLTVVAASHRDLRRLIAEGVFREDLYYRLCGATLHLPPLRMRSDKGFVIAHVLQQEGQQMGLQAHITEEALRVLADFPWPGNIRQLRNALRFALAVCDNGQIDVGHLPQELQSEEPWSGAEPASAPQAVRAGISAWPAKHTPTPALTAGSSNSEQARRLSDSLRHHHWNVSSTARDLGISRATVYRQMERYQIVSPVHSDN
ncbi:MAG: sigma-54-dependent Fis family transcriptional regulator, partial [Rhodoferax sp.]